MLPDTGNNYRLPPGHFVYLMNDVLGQQPVGIPDFQRGVFPAPGLKFLQPVNMPVGGNQFIYFLKNHPDIADDRHINTHIFTDFGRVYVNMDNMGTRGKSTYFTGNSIIKPHAHGHHQVSMVNRQIGINRTVHARHSVTENVAFREAADTEQSGDYRYLRGLRQPFQFGICPGDSYSSTGNKERPPGFTYRLDHLLNLCRVSLECRFIAGQIHFIGVVELRLLQKDIPRYVN